MLVRIIPNKGLRRRKSANYDFAKCDREKNGNETKHKNSLKRFKTVYNGLVAFWLYVYIPRNDLGLLISCGNVVDNLWKVWITTNENLYYVNFWKLDQ